MLCPVLQCPAMPQQAIPKTFKEVKFIKDTLMQKAYELSLWKIRDGYDAQSATSTGYHSQVREREGEETEREGGKKEIYFQSKSNPNPNPNPIQNQNQKTESTRPAKKKPSNVEYLE